MSLTVRVGSTDVTSLVLENTFVLTNALGQRDTLTLSLKSDDGSYTPPKGAPVTVTHSDLGVLFAGKIDQARISEFGGPIVSELGCVSWEQIFDRRLCGLAPYVYQPAGAVFADIFNRFCGAEDISASVFSTGPNITVTFDFCTVREAFDQICALATDDTDTYMWDCPNRVLRFYTQASHAAPFDATDTSPYVARPMSVSWSFADFANKVFVRDPEFTTDPLTEEFTGDGAALEFNCALPLAAAPTIALLSRTADVSPDQTETFTTDGSPAYYTAYPIASVTSLTAGLTWTPGSAALTDSVGLTPGTTITVVYQYDLGTTSPTTTTQTVGILGVDTGKQWYWNADSPTITQDTGGTALPYPAVLRVTYQGKQSTVVDAGQDDTSVDERATAEGGSGWYMRLIEASKPGVKSDAVACGQAWLKRHKDVPLAVEYRTDYGGVRAGMYQRCASSKFGAAFDAYFIIESSTLVHDGYLWYWRIRAVNGPMAGGWLQKMRKLAERSTAGLGVTTITSASDSGAVTIDGVPVTY